MATTTPSPSATSIHASAVKVTYASRHKRKRSIAASNQDASDTSEEESPDESPIKVVPAISPKSMLVGRKSVDSLTPRKVEVNLPGPSPKRVRADGNEGSMRKTHRSMASVSTVGSFKLPPSKHSKDDDASSAAETTFGGRKHKSEPERYQFFCEEPACGDFEPHKAFCTNCSSWVPLSEKQPYVIGPWTKHVKGCSKQPSKRGRRASKPVSVASEEGDNASVTSGVHVRRNEAERKAYLEADPNAQDIEEHQATCKSCGKTVKLGNAIKYTLGPWIKHQERCSGAVPSSRVATAERKMKIVNDSQAKNFTTNTVDCKVCGDRIKLEGEGDYNLNKWEEHKDTCQSSETAIEAESAPAVAGTPEPSSPAKAAQAARASPSASSVKSQPSVASVTTLVADAPTPARSPLKRAREEDDEATAEEAAERAAPRTRTEEYVAVEGETPYVPGIMEWIKYPWKSFLRGWAKGSGTAVDAA